MLPSVVIDNPNVLPVDLSQDNRLIIWRDVGQCRFTHSFFDWSLDAWENEHGTGSTYETEISFLERVDFEHCAVEPKAFIFHMSRCGSTVLSKAIAQSSHVVVMSEVPVVNKLLNYLCGCEIRNVIYERGKRRILRNLILALGRKRWDSQQSYVVKFSSWNIMLLDSIRTLFPSVPCLFVYRDPAEVLVSHLHNATGFVAAKGALVSQSLTGMDAIQLQVMEQIEYIARCLRGLMVAGLSKSDFFLGYPNVTRESVPAILRHFNIACPHEHLEAMMREFDHDSKAVAKNTPFDDDTHDKRRSVSGEVQDAVSQFLAHSYQALESSGRNLRFMLDGESSSV